MEKFVAKRLPQLTGARSRQSYQKTPNNHFMLERVFNWEKQQISDLKVFSWVGQTVRKQLKRGSQKSFGLPATLLGQKRAFQMVDSGEPRELGVEYRRVGSLSRPAFSSSTHWAGDSGQTYSSPADSFFRRKEKLDLR